MLGFVIGLMACGSAPPEPAAVEAAALPVVEAPGVPALPPTPSLAEPGPRVAGTLTLQEGSIGFRPCANMQQPAGGIADLVPEIREVLKGAPAAYVELGAHLENGGLIADRVEVALVDGLACGASNALWTWRGFGNEPFWSVEITGDHATVRTAEGMNVNAEVTGQITATEASWSGRDGDRMVSIRFTTERCVDTMAEAFYGLKAEVTVGERTYTGCARRRIE